MTAYSGPTYAGDPGYVSPRAAPPRNAFLKPRRMGVVWQVQLAFSPGARLATLIGFLLGGFVPLATYVLSHSDLAALGIGVGDTRRLWALLAGGLIYSAKTVYEWAKLAFTSALKSVGFCVLLEGVMVTSSTKWLALAALCYLIVINGVATGCTLSIGGRRT